jgi:tetratricopeptide (TPR) repeat protein
MLPHPDTDPVAATLFQQANTLLAAQRPGDAVAPLVECLRRAPGFGPGYITLANVLRQFGELAQARAMAEAGLALLPDDPTAAMCFAAILHDSADFCGAAGLYQRLLAQDPGTSPELTSGVLSSLASSLQAAGRLADALPLHARAVALTPDSANAHYNYADALLAAGDFAAGWDEYEWRFARPHARPRGFGPTLTDPAWTGGELAGATILLHAEQGFGDTLQFARYAPMVAERGGRVVLEVQPALVRLMRSLAGVMTVVAQGDDLPAFSAHCPLLSLPRAFATRLATVPCDVPYLHADPAAAASWDAALPRGGLRVGLVWAGSAHPTATGLSVFDQRRSLPLTAFAPLGGIPGVQFISLQTGSPAAQLHTPPPGLAVLQALGEAPDFADTAALIATLDLVIAVDTAVAHLAGALGRPVWLLSRVDGCWRWLDGRDDSPWYPTMRVYRQRRALEWGAVMERVRVDLGSKARALPPDPIKGQATF